MHPIFPQREDDDNFSLRTSYNQTNLVVLWMQNGAANDTQ